MKAFYICASEKKLINELRITKQQAKMVRDLCHGDLDPYEIPKAARWARECYHTPNHREMLFVALDDVLDGFGVELIRTKKMGNFEYINFGQTYSATLCFSYKTDRFFVSSQGDLAEIYGGY